MNPICKLCKGATIAAITGSLILYCPFEPQKHTCPYLPPEQHTHNEVYVPPQYQNLVITVATSASAIDHGSLIDIIDDTERPGFKKYVLKFEV